MRRQAVRGDRPGGGSDRPAHETLDVRNLFVPGKQRATGDARQGCAGHWRTAVRRNCIDSIATFRPPSRRGSLPAIQDDRRRHRGDGGDLAAQFLDESFLDRPWPDSRGTLPRAPGASGLRLRPRSGDGLPGAGGAVRELPRSLHHHADGAAGAGRGAFLALWYFGQTLNIFSQIGMIMLIGLITKNGILITWAA